LYSAPAIGTDGVIYVSGDHFWAINPNGKLKWTLNYGDGSSSPAIGADGTIYIVDVPGGALYLYALRSDGSQKWGTFALMPNSTDTVLSMAPAVAADGTVYVGSSDYNLYAFRSLGALKWKLLLTNGKKGEDYGSCSSPAIGADGTIYVGSGDGSLYAVKPDGSQKWRFTTGGPIISSPAVSGDGTIYFGSRDKNFYAIKPDGTLRWKFTTGAIQEIDSSPAIGADGTVYFTSQDGNLYAVGSAQAG
jgi:outer membrane protein assembly factor BamB